MNQEALVFGENDLAFHHSERTVFLKRVRLRRFPCAHWAHEIPEVIVLPGCFDELLVRRQVDFHRASELLRALVGGTAEQCERQQENKQQSLHLRTSPS